jgi:hypothetical protein
VFGKIKEQELSDKSKQQGRTEMYCSEDPARKVRSVDGSFEIEMLARLSATPCKPITPMLLDFAGGVRTDIHIMQPRLNV